MKSEKKKKIKDDIKRMQDEVSEVGNEKRQGENRGRKLLRGTKWAFIEIKGQIACKVYLDCK